MRLIVAQGETIQAQLRRLRDKDDQIDLIEQHRHRLRMRQMGANYLIDTYLGEEDEPNDQDIPRSITRSKEQHRETTKAEKEQQATTKTDPQLNAHKGDEKGQCCVQLYEQILEVYRRLNAEEEKINRLTVALQQEWSNRPSSTTCPKSDNPEVKCIKDEVESVAALNATLAVEIAENERTLHESRMLIGDKQQYIVRLTADVEALESDGNDLQEQRVRVEEESSTCSPGSSGDDSGIQRDHSSAVTPEKDKEADTDSNSDTGLSSLHSSSDDNSALDTLV